MIFLLLSDILNITEQREGKKLNIRIADILQAKIAEIQNRVPLKIQNNVTAVPFDKTLEKAVEGTTNRSFMLDTAKKTLPLVSGSYEAEYPRLSYDEISSLMPRINEAITSASQKYGIDENMIRAIIKTESSFQPFSLSTSGAMGLMQLMPGTASWLSVADPYNIEQNIHGGTEYFRDQLAGFNGNTELALAAYNAGPNAVKGYNGIPPEAANYVKKVLEYYQLYNSSQL